ncbi:MAG: AAA family ATPase, partial [Chloroflexota bacterium]
MAKVRVLIVDDVQESRDNVERLLKFEGDIEIVGKAAGGREAIEMTLSKQPTVVLMDVNMPDIDGIEATRSILSQRPNTGVIMMSVLNEPDILRRSMLAGAREYLVKPFSLDELLDGVRTVHEMVEQLPKQTAAPSAPAQESKSGNERPPGQARIISFVGSKGGVGKSFLAANFAVALREATNQRVALVDASMAFGDIGLMMNITDAKSIEDAVQYAGSIDSELMETLMQDHASGVQVLLAPTSPQDAETITADIVRDALTVLVTMFDYIVVDTSPGFDDLTLQVYDVSDLLLLVTTMDMASIKDARQFLEITDLLDYEQDRVRIVLNRSNTYSGIPAHEIGESLRREIWCE